jgi:hypothetical protein
MIITIDTLTKLPICVTLRATNNKPDDRERIVYAYTPATDMRGYPAKTIYFCEAEERVNDET